ncbi:hypothetical protein FRC07_012965, partial [Ceratobasidium sp. 392]
PTVSDIMGDHQRPPPKPVTDTSASSHSGSSSSVPSTMSYVDDHGRTSVLSTSPSGRLTFLFPPTHKSRSHSSQQNSHGSSLVELPHSELLPSPTSASSGEGKRRVLLPRQAPLKLITDETFANVFGPPGSRGTVSSAPGSLEAWVTSSRQTIVQSKVQPEEDQEKEE